MRGLDVFDVVMQVTIFDGEKDLGCGFFRWFVFFAVGGQADYVIQPYVA